MEVFFHYDLMLSTTIGGHGVGRVDVDDMSVWWLVRGRVYLHHIGSEWRCWWSISSLIDQEMEIDKSQSTDDVVGCGKWENVPQILVMVRVCGWTFMHWKWRCSHCHYQQCMMGLAIFCIFHEHNPQKLSFISTFPTNVLICLQPQNDKILCRECDNPAKRVHFKGVVECDKTGEYMSFHHQSGPQYCGRCTTTSAHGKKNSQNRLTGAPGWSFLFDVKNHMVVLN